MSKRLRVLIVEDSEDDALLVVRELKRGGYDPIFERVETGEAMTTALEKQAWDIVISDHKTPHFSATEALKLLQKSGIDLPFILVSGSIGEETAVAIMKSGAHDYIMKDNLKRLVPAVARELREAEVRQQRMQAEEELKKSEEKLSTILENTRDVIFQLSPLGKIVYVSPKSIELYGYEPSNLIGKHLKKTTPVSELPKALKVLKRVLSGETVSNFEINQIDANGNIIPMEINATPVRKEGKIVAVEGILRDITERKQAEEQIQHLNLVLRAIRKVNQLITKEKDREKLLKGACDNLTETHGYYNAWIALLDESGRLITAAEAGLGKNFLPLVERLKSGELPVCGQRALIQSDAVVINDPPSTCAECPLADKYAGRGAITVRLQYDGKLYGLLVASVPIEFITSEEEQVPFREIAEDIAFALHSLELEEERRQAEEELQESEKRYRLLAENAKDAIWTVDMNMRPIYISPSITRLLGYSVEEAMALPMEAVYTPASFETAMKVFTEEMAIENMGQKDPSRSRTLELELNCKDSSVVPVEINYTFIREPDGRPIAILAIARDITERRQAEEQIKRAAEEWRTTFDSITDLVSIHAKDFRLTRVNKPFANTFNMRPQQLIGKTCYKIIHGTTKPVQNCPHLKTLETKKPATAEFFEPRLGIHLEVTTSPIFDENGEVVASVHVARDITERKKMEEQLIVTDRLASIGELASGIAHELNNPLTSVIGFSELLSEKSEKDVPDDIKDDLEIINREAKRTEVGWV